MKLIIVESPAKCGKIESFLGSGYKCLASFGHIREINFNSLKSIDVNNNYQVTFKPTRSKSQNISNLRKWIKKAEESYFENTDDEGGNSVAYLANCFNLPITTTKRIIFRKLQNLHLKMQFKIQQL